jgi:hypothetical protein
MADVLPIILRLYGNGNGSSNWLGIGFSHINLELRIREKALIVKLGAHAVGAPGRIGHFYFINSF